MFKRAATSCHFRYSFFWVQLLQCRPPMCIIPTYKQSSPAQKPTHTTSVFVLMKRQPSPQGVKEEAGGLLQEQKALRGPITIFVGTPAHREG